jgi:microcystin-dependent protein
VAQVFIGSLMLVPYTFPPTGWAFCAGQLMDIRTNTALFSLLGTTFGGDGRTTFGLPNLQAAIPVGQGQGSGLSPYVMGQAGGTPNVTLTQNEVPPHSHALHAASLPPSSVNPSGAALAEAPLFTTDTSKLIGMDPTVIVPMGSSQAHNNMMPYQTLNWIICLNGIFPPRS